MTRKAPSGEAKIAVAARVDAALIQRLDDLAKLPGVNFQRSRSELVAFAIAEYVERHGKQAKK